MRKVKRTMVATALAAGVAATLGGSTAVASNDISPSSISPNSTCGDRGKIESSGAEGHVTVSCQGGKITAQGWVKDTERDGQCAQVYGNVGNKKFESKRACPSGATEKFSFTGKGKTANIYLREIG